jgi:hypothetical protein
MLKCFISEESLSHWAFSPAFYSVLQSGGISAVRTNMSSNSAALKISSLFPRVCQLLVGCRALLRPSLPIKPFWSGVFPYPTVGSDSGKPSKPIRLAFGQLSPCLPD